MKDLNHRMIGFVPSTCQLKAPPAEASIVLVHKLYTNRTRVQGLGNNETEKRYYKV